MLAALALTASAQHPRDKDIHDPDTLAWWHTTEALSNDGMEGRDTGSAAYQRAAEMVAARFKAAGLQAGGEIGTYLQTVPMHQVDIEPAKSYFTLSVGISGELGTGFKFLEEITAVPPADAVTDKTADVVFRGYCGKDAMSGVIGKFVICFGTQRTGLPGGAERLANVRSAGGIGIINVDDPYFTIEPPRWPFAYARSVVLRESNAKPPQGRPFLSLRLSADAFTRMMGGSGHDAAEILKTGGSKQPLANFDLTGYSLHVHLETTERDISSPNILAVLPGSDPKLKAEYVVIAAHLDGYGFGTPVNGDSLYNGTLDDAAYVALLIQMAEDIQAGKLPKPKRSILFAAFTGEEKGLLGSNWYVKHPTVPLARTVADVNLDQLRPLFPLNILTAEAVSDSTLGATASAVAKPMGIAIRPDMEPERNLLRRADQYPFLASGVPAISFIFGYDPGTDAEKRYREWYQVRYHRPQDDLTQPMDFTAAAKFNVFFYRLVETIGDAPARPAFLPESPFAAKR